MEGWVKLYPDMLDRFSGKPELLQLAVYLLLTANTEPQRVKLGGTEEEILPGQVLTTLSVIADDISRPLRKPKDLNKRLSQLERTGFCTIDRKKGFVIITVHDWPRYVGAGRKRSEDWPWKPNDPYRDEHLYRYIPVGVREAVYRRDRYTCVYCGATEHLSIDHILPITRGGNETETNLATCCLNCNSTKNARTPEEAGMDFRFGNDPRKEGAR